MAAEKPTGKRFLFLFLVDPHDPYAAQKIEKMFLKGYKGKLCTPSWDYKNDPQRRTRCDYCSMASIRYTVTYLSGFGSISRAKESNKTTVFLTADHGEGMGEHGFIFMHISFGKVIRVPLLVWGPRSSRAKILAPQSIDITQTILEMADAKEPSLPGRSPGSSLDNGVVISEYEFGIRRQAIVGSIK